MNSSNIYDNRTLFIKCDCASAEQIRQAFNEALTTYQTTAKVNLQCRFRVNLVENREGKSFGIAFVFVTNPAVYYMLLGKNPDGSDRIEYRDDLSWSPPAEGDSMNDGGWSTISVPVFTTNWSATTDDEIQHEPEQKRPKYVCPKIPVPLEPLMILPPYHLTSDQIEEKRAKIVEDNEGKSGFDHSLVEIPEVSHFVVDRAMASPVDQKFMPNILKCKGIPDWVTKEDLKMQFSPYASDAETSQERFIKGRRVEETYPFVNINEDRVAFIIFDSSTNDALFALHMMKKTIIRKKASDGTINNVTLIFGHSFRTDRDLMADISQKPRPINHRDNNSSRQTRDGEGYDQQRSRGRNDQYTRDNNSRDNNSRENISRENNSRNNNSRENISRENNSRNNNSRDNGVRRAVANAVPQRRQPVDGQMSNKFALLNLDK